MHSITYGLMVLPNRTTGAFSHRNLARLPRHELVGEEVVSKPLNQRTVYIRVEEIVDARSHDAAYFRYLDQALNRGVHKGFHRAEMRGQHIRDVAADVPDPQTIQQTAERARVRAD